jgi:YegS/Rv2252/BmrU family lipid kinase
MPTDEHWIVIVNPASGRPDGGAAWRAIEQALRDAGVAFDAVHTERPQHGQQLVQSALAAGRRCFLVVGGDGSVNDVVQGIMSSGLADTREVTLAVAPHGTGNDWSRSWHVPRNPARIARFLARGRTVLHDVGLIDFAAPGSTRRWFINVAGAGYDAEVTANVPRPVPSAFTYLGIALRGLARYRAPRFVIRADGASIDRRLLLAFVANARYCGNRMHVVPTAEMDDGELDVLAVRELTLLQALPKLAKLYTGRILGDEAVQHLRAARVRIETDPQAVIQADGQIVGTTPAEFGVARQALRVRVP